MTLVSDEVWADPALAAQVWGEAQTLDPAALGALLADATTVCRAYAPTLPATTSLPAGWARAVVLQAREIHAAALREGDVIGMGEAYPIRARPLTGAVKALLRPRRAVPSLG
jgi:hypothetical protein